MNPVEASEVRSHLERVAASREFADSERMRRFLRFTVESKLNGQPDRVKEYILGREVFDRTDGYDPRLDPIVRVEARRLRSKLDTYYSGPGHAERIRVEYPKGSYLPVFTRVTSASVRRSTRKWVWVCAAALAIVLIGAIAYRLSAPRPVSNDMLAVVPARWIEPNHGDLDAADVDLAEAVTGELANRRVARVLAWPLVMRHQGGSTSIHDVASSLDVSRLLIVSVRDQNGAKIVGVFLINTTTGEKLRMQQYFAPAIGTFTEQIALAHRIADDIAANTPR